MKITPPLRAGFTLVEGLIVVAVFALLAGLCLPAIARMREWASVVSCRNNLRQLALAVHQHHDQHQRMPAYATGKKSEIFGSWFIPLLPFIEQGPVLDKIQRTQNTASGGIKLVVPLSSVPGVGDATFRVLLCDSDPSRVDSDANKTNYLANWYTFTSGAGGVYTPAQSFGQLTDGLSHAILFGEGYAQCKKTPRPALVSAFYHNFGVTGQAKASDDPTNSGDFTMFQVKPLLPDCDPWRSQTGHEAMNLALGDGSVRPVRAPINLDLWKQALKPRDGFLAELDW